MTVAEWCVFGSVILYLLTIASVKWIGFRSYDNANPRDPAFYQDELRARALGAHQNGIETFPFFAVAVLLAEFRAAPQNLINELAILRSISWSIGFIINVAIFFLPLIRLYLPR
jgi:uncharacterized MAPEG superfamily protein